MGRRHRPARPRLGDGHRPLRLHAVAAADAGQRQPDAGRGRLARRRQLPRLPRRCARLCLAALVGGRDGSDRPARRRGADAGHGLVRFVRAVARLAPAGRRGQRVRAGRHRRLEPAGAAPWPIDRRGPDGCSPASASASRSPAWSDSAPASGSRRRAMPGWSSARARRSSRCSPGAHCARRPARPLRPRRRCDRSTHRRGAWSRATALVGFGYILPATFLPAAARELFADPALLRLDLAAVRARRGGIDHRRVAPVPRHRCAPRSGARASSSWRSACSRRRCRAARLALLVCAVCVGGTFMVLTMAAMQVAREVGGPARRRLIAAMTAAFATGQLLGPLTVERRRCHGWHAERAVSGCRGAARARHAAVAALARKPGSRCLVRLEGLHHDDRSHASAGRPRR